MTAIQPAAAISSPTEDEAYLALLGERVRAWRDSHRITRKALALSSGVSENGVVVFPDTPGGG